MKKYDLGDPRLPMPIGMDDLDKAIHRCKAEIISEIVALQVKVESHDWWQCCSLKPFARSP